MARKEEGTIIFDYLTDFKSGMNAGVEPQLLGKDQMATGLNTTVRGGFATHRPGYHKIDLSAVAGTVLSDFQNNLFQGACYYHPDTGPQVIMVSIAGKLFRVDPVAATTENVTGTCAQSDIQQQAWLWQSEKWVIWNDGLNNPVFYDGVSTRRSLYPSTLLATVQANATVPPVNSVVQLTLVSAWPSTAPNGGMVMVGSVPYQVLATLTGYEMEVTNLTDTVGATLASGTAVTSQPSNLGTTSAPFTQPARFASITLRNLLPAGTYPVGTGFYGNASYAIIFRLAMPFVSTVGNYNTSVTWYIDRTLSVMPTLAGINIGGTAYTNFPVTAIAGPTTVQVHTTIPYVGNAGVAIKINGNPYTIDSIVSTTILACLPTSDTPAAGTVVASGVDIVTADAQPITTVGVIAADATSPAVAAQVTLTLDRTPVIDLNSIVWIGTKAYQVYNLPSSITTTLNVRNLYDTPSNVIAAGTQIKSIPELPPGRMGAYGLGRNWMALTDGKQFMGGDIVGGSAGTPPDYRDAVLKSSENTYLAGGGNFTVPGSVGDIRSMMFVPILDRQMGQGPLMVGTPNAVFSCDAPVDRTTWQALTNPILTEALKPHGPLSQSSTVAANGDMLFRFTAGTGSLVLGRRDFATWGNTPISDEVHETYAADDRALLSFSTACVFDNRYIQSATPTAGPLGVYHAKAIALNFDPISSLRGKLPSVYDGIWSGLNVLQYVVGEFNGEERCFALTYNTTDNKIELYEILTDTEANDDDGSAISWEVQSPVLFQDKTPAERTFKRLNEGEIYVKDIVGSVVFTVQFRADHDDTWHDWYSWTVDDANGVTYQPRMGLGETPTTGSGTGRPWREGFIFFVRIQITGHCVFMGARFSAAVIPQPEFAPPMSAIPVGIGITGTPPTIIPINTGYRILNGNQQLYNATDALWHTFKLMGSPPTIVVDPNGEA